MLPILGKSATVSYKEEGCFLAKTKPLELSECFSDILSSPNQMPFHCGLHLWPKSLINYIRSYIMIKRSLACAACVAAFAVSASAGSMGAPTPTPAIAPVVEADKSWTGFYAGVSVNKTTGGIYKNENGGSFPVFEDKTVGGAFVGYNWQRGNFVYGGELNYTSVDTEMVLYSGTSQGPMLDLRARAGYALNNVLVYGFAGLAASSISGVAGRDYDMSGFSYGAGAEMYVYKDIFAGLEVSRRNVDYNSIPSNAEVGSEIDQISLRVGYNF